jgi:uncharacterized protein GlcG (DUF336 family)
MRSLIICVGVALVAIPAIYAAEPAVQSPLFPGDLGRPFNGLPLPDGPTRRPPWPTKPAPAPALGIDLAYQLAQAAVAACQGSHVGVSIIDSAGTPKLYYVPDGTAGYHAYTAFRKAYTALTFKLPTSEVGLQSKSDSALAAKITADTNLLSFPGGLPITENGVVVGAIGVSGAEPSAIDEKCALQALGELKDQIK